MGQTQYIWCEKYRPESLSEYIGNDHLKSKFTQYLQSGDIPHLLFYGKAGTGKTTLAKIIVKNIECDYLYLNASDERNIDTVRDKIKVFASSVGFKPLKVVILDESDYLTPISQAALRNVMETFSQHTRFILTCNYVERIIDPIQSRCQSYNITPPSKKDVGSHLYKILHGEGVDFQIDEIAVLVNASYPDIRQVINSTQRQVVNKKLVIDTSSIIEKNYKLRLIELLINRSPFKDIRQLTADNHIEDYNELFRLLYDEVDTYAPNAVPDAILKISDAQYKDAHAVDKEINFMALIINILKLEK
jgi:replication factor C small subunit|tara:strand:+ start:5060 stop:5971 length:912 start_codon:yes stop_codon:yes gene_type:complete